MAERKARMTDAERIKALLRREKPDRVPIWPFAAVTYAAYARISIADTYNNPTMALDGQRRTAEHFGWVFVPWLGYAAMGAWEFGGDIKWPSGEWAQAPSVTRYPVEKPEDVWKLQVPDYATSGFVPLQAEFYKLSIQERLDNEPFNMTAAVAGDGFSRAGNICGPEKLCRWTLKQPEAAHHLIRLATDYTKAGADYWKDTFGLNEDGVLGMGGTVTTDNRVISPRIAEEFVLPYMKEIYEYAMSIGYKVIYSHLCGEQNQNLPLWAKIPMGDPGILSIGHEVELETAAEYFPNDIILGNLEPVKLQVETPEEVYEASKVLIERGKKISGGFIFSPGCGPPPMAPVENMMAMTRAVNDFGWYD
jgi:uroporphyrinogen decarboxylase